MEKRKTEKNLWQCLEMVWKYVVRPNVETMILKLAVQRHAAFIAENGLEKLYGDWLKRRKKNEV